MTDSSSLDLDFRFCLALFRKVVTEITIHYKSKKTTLDPVRNKHVNLEKKKMKDEGEGEEKHVVDSKTK